MSWLEFPAERPGPCLHISGYDCGITFVQSDFDEKENVASYIQEQGCMSGNPDGTPPLNSPRSFRLRVGACVRAARADSHPHVTERSWCFASV